jgi:predicted alpha/beta superfamily hydrolase
MEPPGCVLLQAGEYEQALALFQTGATDLEKRIKGFADSRIVDNARAMAERLARAANLPAEFQFLPGETHMSVLPSELNLAVRFVFGAPAA